MNSRLIIFFVVILISSKPLFSDCYACWELKGVTVTYKDSSQFTGYLLYSYASWRGEYKYEHKNDRFDFPDDVLKLNPNTWFTLVDTSSLVTIDRPIPNALVSLSKPMNYIIAEITSITLYPMKLDGRQGASRLQVVTPDQYKLLQTEPIEVLFGDGGLSDWYLMSYDSAFVGEELKILQDNWWGIQHASQRNPSIMDKYSKIVSFSIPYD